MQSNDTNQSDSGRPGPAAVNSDIEEDNAVPEEVRAGLSDKDSNGSDSTHATDDARVSEDATIAPSDTAIKDVKELTLVPDAALPTGSDIPDTEEGNLAWGVGRLIAWASLACLLTLVNRFIGAALPLPPPDSLPRHFVSLLYLAPLLLSLIQTARAAVALPLSAPFLFVTGAVLALPSLAQVFTTLTHADIPILNSFYTILPPSLQILVNNFLGPIGLCLLGTAIGRIIRHPNTLLAASGIALFFDIVVVTLGPVAQLLKSKSNLIAAVSVGAGGNTTGSAGVNAPKLPDPVSWVTIGPADVLFLALFLSAVYLLKRTWTECDPALPPLAWRDTGRWMFGLLLFALVIVEFFALPIPALAPMGIAVLIANARLAAFTPTERRDLLIGGVFAIFCATLMVLWARKTIPPDPPQLGIQLAMDRRTGWFLLHAIQPGSPAAKAGLLAGDRVTAINGLPIQTVTQAEYEDALNHASQKGVTLTIQHRGEKSPHAVTVGADLFRPNEKGIGR